VTTSAFRLLLTLLLTLGIFTPEGLKNNNNNQFVTHQVPVSQILRCGGRFATSRFGLIVKSNVKQMWFLHLLYKDRNLWPYCQTEWGGPSPPGSSCSRPPITWSPAWSGLEAPSWSTKQQMGWSGSQRHRQHALDVMEISHSSWPWYRSDATDLAGYANMMMMVIVRGCLWTFVVNFLASFLVLLAVCQSFNYRSDDNDGVIAMVTDTTWHIVTHTCVSTWTRCCTHSHTWPWW